MACEGTTRPIFFSALTFLVLFVLRQKVHKKSFEIPSQQHRLNSVINSKPLPLFGGNIVVFFHTPGFVSLHLGLLIFHPFRVRIPNRIGVQNKIAIHIGASTVELQYSATENYVRSPTLLSQSFQNLVWGTSAVTRPKLTKTNASSGHLLKESI
jgi:hypothetical protein